MGRYSYKETLSDEQNLGPQKDWPIVFEWMPSIQGWTCILYVFLFTVALHQVWLCFYFILFFWESDCYIYLLELTFPKIINDNKN